MLPEALEHPDIVARFGREGEVAAKLQGQHVVRIIDVHEMPDGRPYIVMEHLTGEDLEHTLDRLGCLPPSEAVSYMLQACEALDEKHEAVTCQLWDRKRLDEPDVRRTKDSKRRLTPPLWVPPAD